MNFLDFYAESQLNEDWGEFGEQLAEWPYFKNIISKSRFGISTSGMMGQKSNIEDVKSLPVAKKRVGSKDAIALLVFGDGDPAAMAVVTSFGGGGWRDSKKDYSVYVNSEVVPSGIPGKKTTHRDRGRYGRGSSWETDHRYDFYAGSGGQQLNTVVKALKEADMEVTFKIITADLERPKTSAKRQAARRGQVPLPGQADYSKYISGLQSELKSKLDALKSNKAVSVNNQAEFFTYVKESGYLDKIRVGGHVYELYSDRFSFDELTGRRKPWGDDKPRIEYRLENAYRVNKDGPVAPEQLNVILGMEGGSIVPISVEAKRER